MADLTQAWPTLAFLHPWVLLFGLPLVALILWRAARVPPPALAWPALPEALAAGASRHDWQRTTGQILRGIAAAALVIALAGPVGEGRPVRLRHDGLDLLIALDASGSMRALDAEDGGRFRTRIELAREVVARFAEVRVAEGDRVGLVVFGDTAFTQCPLTRDGALLAAALSRVEAGMAGEATALGDALALSVKRVLGDTDPEQSNAPGRPRAGRLVVLLTDGRSNAGSVPTEVAAALAAHHRIRVHTVGIGSQGEVAMATGSAAADARSLERERHDLDATTLQQIATATRGQAFQALSSGDLEAVYQEIDQLERVEREAPPRVMGAPIPEPFLALAALAVGLELVGTRVLGRRLP